MRFLRRTLSSRARTDGGEIRADAHDGSKAYVRFVTRPAPQRSRRSRRHPRPGAADSHCVSLSDAEGGSGGEARSDDRNGLRGATPHGLQPKGQPGDARSPSRKASTPSSARFQACSGQVSIRSPSMRTGQVWPRGHAQSRTRFSSTSTTPSMIRITTGAFSTFPPSGGLLATKQPRQA